MDPVHRTHRPPAAAAAPSAGKLSNEGDTAAPPAISSVEAADLADAQAGDDDAFARIYDRLGPVVLSLCRQRSLSEAEDATQETFIRAYQMLDRVQSPEKLRPWLCAIARRVCSERRRAATRRARHEGDAMLKAARPEAAPDAAEAAQRAEELRRLDAALDRLTKRERLAIHLYYLETDPLKAAESAMELSRSGYYKLLARAREHLAALLREEPPS